ncbi:MAG: phosphatase PAP2 family protein [Algoriphagus sp.]|jgi:undecaprenyl-diphosphatase|uniref:phosphatase PAP2 family protein n=1 Tax=Algoriphagus sp. TaxID=1872435 RepID=UPI0027180B79|nr:phosphatase PAP2 family protein [Algoriphagus sp.]MDO8967545.1 phosphatase PAP2 family protein [Algoriphagus sp.]MDP2042956.1 phosphatase PAP2 family protein [Algoriphagus sp.]MDP3199028.1 phosphatase PAP2 family protein [Algoriphagus sp.]MDP3471451.1 phosphatase PAP2 family protein [Algoriphagus sp.]
MIETLKKWDEELFLWLNSFHTDWLDPIVFQMTETITWIPLYALLIFVIFKLDRPNAWWILGGVALTILAADQFTSGFLKPLMERLRPCHDPRWEGLMHNYGRCGGLYGFVSSHAANTFGLAVFLNRKLKGKTKQLRWLYLYAIVVSYTRIYLGVHYPFDILLGAAIGTAVAWISWFFIVFVKRELIRQALK